MNDRAQYLVLRNVPSLVRWVDKAEARSFADLAGNGSAVLPEYATTGHRPFDYDYL